MSRRRDDPFDVVVEFMKNARERAQPIVHGTTSEAEAAFEHVVALVDANDRRYPLTLGEKYYCALVSATQVVVMVLSTRGRGELGLDIRALAKGHEQIGYLTSDAAETCIAVAAGDWDKAKTIVMNHAGVDETRWPFAAALGYVLVTSIRRSAT